MVRAAAPIRERAALVAVFAIAMLHEASADVRRVVVWPQSPDDDVTGLDAAVREAKLEPVSFDAIRTQLREIGEHATAAESQALDAVQAAFTAARAAYLKQDFTTMADVLGQVEATALPVLAFPRHAAVLWELEFQRGLAELSQNNATGARQRFAFALALDETRVPKREIYGPVVARAFTEAADARAGVPPRPIAIKVTPRDARVVIDGVPIIDNTAPRNLRPGLHVVIASAPGYEPRTLLVELEATQAIGIALAPATGTAVEKIGRTWADGALDPGTDSGRRAIVAAAVEAGADAALVVDVDATRGEATARLLATDAGPGGNPTGFAGRGAEGPGIERRPSAATAAAAVFAKLAGEPMIEHRNGNGTNPSSGSVFGSWWLWTAVGVVAIGAGVTIYATTRDDKIRIHSP